MLCQKLLLKLQQWLSLNQLIKTVQFVTNPIFIEYISIDFTGHVVGRSEPKMEDDKLDEDDPQV